jgi:hypothetical protein
VSLIAEKDHLHDLGQMLKYGNHKSAKKEQECLVGMLWEEVQRMWQLPLTHRAIACIPDCIMAPLGMGLQQTINEFSEIVAKWQLTHNQTYEPTLGKYRSINHRTQFKELNPCHYGRTLACHIYNIINNSTK